MCEKNGNFINAIPNMFFPRICKNPSFEKLVQSANDLAESVP